MSKAEYLKLMGVDLYVSRSTSSSAMLSDHSHEVPAKEAYTPKNVLVEPILDSINAENTPQPEALNTEQEIHDLSQARKGRIDINADAIEIPEIAESSEIVETSEITEADNIEPIYFLWQQVGSTLFISLSFEQQDNAENKLLSAILSSLGSVEKVDQGRGNWPFESRARGTQSDAEHFLASFVDGRSELLGDKLCLVVLGGMTQKFFPETTESLKEIRVLPALIDMLKDASLKPIAWRSIMDLRDQ